MVLSAALNYGRVAELQGVSLDSCGDFVVQVYPIRLRPRVCERVWGGERIVRKLARPGRAGACIGESWEVFGELEVENGLYAGRTLDELMLEYGPELLGRVAPVNGRFPLLVKWLDTREWLSVQVHPDDAVAQRLADSAAACGKTECWYVIEADAGSELIHGLRDDVSPEQLGDLQGAAVLGLLRRVPVGQGDVFFVGSGTVHALGPGVTLLEVQQSCDLTYRLYDWERQEKNGQRRELHLREARESVLHAQPVPMNLDMSEKMVGEPLCCCPYFAMDLLQATAAEAKDGTSPGLTWTMSGESPEVIVVVQGAGWVRLDGESVPLALGDSVVLPASGREVSLGLSHGGRAVRIFLPC